MGAGVHLMGASGLAYLVITILGPASDSPEYESGRPCEARCHPHKANRLGRRFVVVVSIVPLSIEFP